MDKKIRNIISEHLFFQNFDHKYIDILTESAHEVEFKEGEFLLTEGENADKFYLILSGSVYLDLFSPKKGLSKLDVIGEGEIVGFSWICSPYKWSFDVKAKENTKTLCFDAKKIKIKSDQIHEFGYKLQKIFIQIIIERLQATRMTLLDELDEKNNTIEVISITEEEIDV